MKLKGLLKGLCILGLTLLPISFSSADFRDVSCQTFTNQSTMVVYDNTILTFRNGNFTTNRLNNNIEHVMWLTNKNFVSNPSSNDSNLSSFFAWYNGNPYIFAGYYGDNFQGFPQNVCVESLSGFDISTYGASMNCNSETINSFLLAGNINGGSICYPNTTNTYAYGLFTYCFYDDNYAYCFKITSYRNSPDKQVLTLSGTLNLPGRVNVSSLQAIDWSISPFTNSNTPIEYYVSTGSCPSVGQLKSSSGLTPAVCYAGFDENVSFSDSVYFKGGEGIDIFRTYELTSGGMTIQNWYDTYWNYYQNIQADPFPFQVTYKALVGIQVARQTFGNTAGTLGSFKILNYCYYVVNNISDNSSTCTIGNVSTAYSGITITDQDRQDIVDAVNDNYVVHRPGSGSIFNGDGGAGGGGASWGDECSGIPCLFDKFYSMFTSSRVNDVDFTNGGNGILPYYISMAFVIVVLYYVFKR